MKSRHLARTVALQTLASLFLNDDDEKARFDFVCREIAPRLSNTDFAKKIVDGVKKHRAEIDQKIEKFAPEWPIEKLAPVERAILEIGIFEICFEKMPAPVAIDEAVELAKEFGDESAGKFINGVLNAVFHDEKNGN